MKYPNIMIDLETYGTAPNAVILSIGAVAFTSEKVCEEVFYTNVDREDGARIGLSTSQDTVNWWEQQSDKAKARLLAPTPKPVLDALTEFSDWLRRVGGVYLWGNGADFDNPILRSAAVALDVELPIKPYNGRCYRTIKNIPEARNVVLDRIGVHHNAVDDALSQANHLIAINKHLREKFGLEVL